MTLALFALILLSVGLSSLAQISLKAGMGAVAQGTTQAVAAGVQGGASTIVAALTQPYVIVGLGLYAFGALVWMLVLSRMQVSVAYPFVALGFVFVMILGAVAFGEPITVVKVLGTCMVGGGVWLISHG